VDSNGAARPLRRTDEHEFGRGPSGVLERRLGDGVDGVVDTDLAGAVSPDGHVDVRGGGDAIWSEAHGHCSKI